MLTAIDHMLTDGTLYKDLNAGHFQRRSPQARAHYLANQIAELGVTCTIAPHQAETVSI